MSVGPPIKVLRTECSRIGLLKQQKLSFTKKPVDIESSHDHDTQSSKYLLLRDHSYIIYHYSFTYYIIYVKCRTNKTVPYTTLFCLFKKKK